MNSKVYFFCINDIVALDSGMWALRLPVVIFLSTIKAFCAREGADRFKDYKTSRNSPFSVLWLLDKDGG